MAEKQTFIDQIKNFFNKLSLSQKVFLGFVVIFTIAGIFIITNIANQLTYGVLYSNLSMRDSGLIVEKLKEKKVPYEVEANGSIVKVPEDKIAELRISLAAEGLPEGSGVGFEIFDKTSLSTTDFVQNINYIRALEGELARSISELKEVSSARVHISLPKRSVFVDDSEEAKASIVLKLKPGAVLNNSIIPAIIHLVAQSVEGLKPDNIAIVDIYGRLLSKPKSGNEDYFDKTSNTQIAFQKKLEQDFVNKIVSLIEPIVGKGKVRANVRLKLDFSKVETKQEEVDPEKIAKVSEKSETSSSTGSTKGGVPGVSSNVAQASGNQASTSKPSKSKSEKSLVNYEVSKKITHLIKPAGEIQRISAAVVVDDFVDVKLEGGELKRIRKPRTPQELETIKKIVQAAIGYKPERGDNVEVANLSFDTSFETESEYYSKKQKTSELINTLIKYGSIILGFLLVFFLIVKPIFKKANVIIKSAISPKSEDIEIPKVDGEKIAAIEEAKEEIEIEKELREKYKIPKEVKKMTVLKEKVLEFAKEHTDETAVLIKGFLMEDR